MKKLLENFRSPGAEFRGQFRHDRIYFVYFDKNMFFFQPFYDIIMLIIVKGKEKI